MQGRPRGIWRPAGVPRGRPQDAAIKGLGTAPGTPRPRKLINWWLWAISVAGVVFYVAGVVFYLAGVAFGGQQACPGGAPGVRG